MPKYKIPISWKEYYGTSLTIEAGSKEEILDNLFNIISKGVEDAINLNRMNYEDREINYDIRKGDITKIKEE